MTQSDIFWDREGDAWLDRNRTRLGVGDDPVIHVMARLPRLPKTVLEIGSSNGWRLENIRHYYPQCEVFGVEPSEKAVAEAAEKRIPTYRCVAKCLPLPDKRVDVVILGFCLYVCDPADYFKIAAEVDRVLAVGGTLIIHDFISPFPYFRRYKHNTAISCFHFQPHKLWTGSPCYTIVARFLHTDGQQYVMALGKVDWPSAFTEHAEGSEK